MRAFLPAGALAAALAVTGAGCQSAGSAASSGTGTAASSAASPSGFISASVSQPPVEPASPSPVSSVPSTHELTVYFAEGGDTNGTAVHASACSSGCPLSGDGTTSLWDMTWPTWNPVEAVGTGTEKIDDCNPSCATGKLYPVRVTVTFRDPVLVCTAKHTPRFYWTRASFTWPEGLPTTLSGDNTPVNPVTYANITAESTPSCG